MFKNILIGISGLNAFLAILVGFGLFGLEWQRFFLPRQQNIQREVFENTQSYVHGKTQDLAKYYEEYAKSDESEREAIRQLIIMNFAQFETGKLQSQTLQNFLIQMRGY